MFFGGVVPYYNIQNYFDLLQTVNHSFFSTKMTEISQPVSHDISSNVCMLLLSIWVKQFGKLRFFSRHGNFREHQILFKNHSTLQHTRYVKDR